MSPKILKFGHGVNWLIICLVLFCSPIAAARNGTVPPPSLQDGRNAPDPKIKVTPSMAIVLVCLVSGFFVMGCISLYVRQCTERNTGLSFNQPEIGIHTRRAAARGLDRSVFETFPTFLYSDVKGLKIGKSALECAVCLNEFEDDEILRLLPKCSHVFHPDCIGTWLASHVTCPVCRANLIPRPGEIRSVTILSHDSDSNILNSEIPPLSRGSNEGIIIEIEPREVTSSTQTPNQNRPRQSHTSKARRFSDLPKSHSTGHSLIQPGENCERFTLRLPEEVRNELMNTSLNRTRSCVVFPRAHSTRKGYKRGARFDVEESSRSNQWGFMRTPPFFARAGSTRSESRISGGDNSTVVPKNMFKSVRLPFEKLFSGTDKDNDNDNDKDNVGERSFDRLNLGGPS